MGEIKQTNFRLDEEKVAEFRAFCEEQGYNQAQGFDHLMNVLALEQAKNVISNRETEISEFQMHAKAIVEAFVRSLELCNNAEARIREDYSSQLDSKDRQIMEYQAKISELKAEVDSLNKQIKTSDDVSKKKDLEIAELKKHMDAASKQVDTYKASNDALTASLALANEKAQSNEETVKNYSSTVKELEKVKKELEAMQALMLQTEEKHKMKLSLLQHNHEVELKQNATQNQLDIKEALEKTKADYQDKIDALKDEYEAKIDKINEDTAKRVDLYQEKLEKANEKMENLREKMQEQIDKYKNLSHSK